MEEVAGIGSSGKDIDIHLSIFLFLNKYVNNNDVPKYRYYHYWLLVSSLSTPFRNSTEQIYHAYYPKIRQGESSVKLNYALEQHLSSLRTMGYDVVEQFTGENLKQILKAIINHKDLDEDEIKYLKAAFSWEK